MSDKLTTPIDSTEYSAWRDSMIAEIEHQRLSAVMQLNAATLQHYWWMGAAILKKQQEPDSPFLQAALAKFPTTEDGLILRVPLSQITWYHHISLLQKVKDNHKATKVIDLEFDKNGDYIPYSSSSKSSPLHNWKESETGTVGRKRHEVNNRHSIPSEYKALIEKIVKYNKEKHKWSKEKSQ